MVRTQEHGATSVIGWAAKLEALLVEGSGAEAVLTGFETFAGKAYL